jgi:hypothetical protein
VVCTKPSSNEISTHNSNSLPDVGGGSVRNGTRHTLARIPLRWMIRQCFLAKTGIRFHTSLFRQVGLDPTTLYPEVKPRPPALYVSSLLSAAQTQMPFVTEQATADIHTSIPPTNTDVPPAPSHSPTPSTSSLSNIPRRSSQAAINHADTHLSVSAMIDKLSTRSALGTLTEEEEDLADALSPIYDQLDIALGWWSLELIPLPQRYQLQDNTWVDTWT